MKDALRHHNFYICRWSLGKGLCLCYSFVWKRRKSDNVWFDKSKKRENGWHIDEINEVVNGRTSKKLYGSFKEKPCQWRRARYKMNPRLNVNKNHQILLYRDFCIVIRFILWIQKALLLVLPYLQSYKLLHTCSSWNCIVSVYQNFKKTKLKLWKWKHCNITKWNKNGMHDDY